MELARAKESESNPRTKENTNHEKNSKKNYYPIKVFYVEITVVKNNRSKIFQRVTRLLKLENLRVYLSDFTVFNLNAIKILDFGQYFLEIQENMGDSDVGDESRMLVTSYECGCPTVN